MFLLNLISDLADVKLTDTYKEIAYENTGQYTRNAQVI